MVAMPSLRRRQQSPASTVQAPAVATPAHPDRALVLFPYRRDTVYLVRDNSGQWGPLWYPVQGEYGDMEYAHMILRTQLGARLATISANFLDLGIRPTLHDRWVNVTGVFTPYSGLGIILPARPVHKSELKAELANGAAATHAPRARAIYPALLDNWPAL